VQSFKVLFGDYQGVAVANRAYIQKGENSIVFVNFCYRNLACRHFAEDTVFPAHLWSFSKEGKLLL
jgi:hypothetical protein